MIPRQLRVTGDPTRRDIYTADVVLVDADGNPVDIPTLVDRVAELEARVAELEPRRKA